MGESITPRPLISTIVKVVDPKIGDKIYDGAVGSAGFLVKHLCTLKTAKSFKQGLRNLAKEYFLWQRKEIAGLHYRYHEYDISRSGGTQYHSYQYAV